MKLSFYSGLLVCFLMAPAILAKAQQFEDNTLILRGFGKERFAEVEELLVHNFFLIHEFDTEKYRFSTYERPFSKYPLALNMLMSIHGFMKGDDLYVFAYYAQPSSGSLESTFVRRSVYTRRRNLPVTVSFEEMVRIFAQLEHPMVFESMD